MSRRNSREAKARRRAERASRQAAHAEMHSLAEVAAAAERGEVLPCGCDAAGLLAEVRQIEGGVLPPGWHDLSE